MNSNDNFKAIAELDLDPIKVKLMHKESGEGWSLEKANAMEFEYRRFLILMKKYPNEQTAPLFDVDTFWHYHILDTMKYAIDCEAIFGYFLHHFPYVGLRGEADEEAHQSHGQRMRELYEETFGENYIRTAAAEQVAFSARALQDDAQKTAFSAAAVGAAPQTAFSARVALAGTEKTAFSARVALADAEKTAFSARVALADTEKTAFSARVAAADVAQAKQPQDAVARFYTERPSLPRAN